jgi:hypothetical protein
MKFENLRKGKKCAGASTAIRIYAQVLAWGIVVSIGFPATATAGDPESLSRFRLLTDTGQHIEGKDARLTADSLVARRSDGVSITLSRDRIRALDVSKGTNAGRAAAIGAGIGLLTGLLAIIQVSTDDTRVLKKGAAAGLTVGLTAGGGLIGFAVGSSSPRWQSVPLRTASVTPPDGFYIVHVVRFSL